MNTTNTTRELKINNRILIFDAIRDSEESLFSCAKIARQTGISLPTVIKVVAHLSQKGILTGVDTEIDSESPAEPNPIGRPPSLLRFNPDAYSALGAAYDGKYLNIALVNLRYGVIASKKIYARESIWEILHTSFADEAERLLIEQGVSAERLIGVGIALPVIVDVNRYQATFSAPMIGLPGPYDFAPVFNRLSQRFSCPVLIENDVNAAAIGVCKERRLSPGNDLVYITLGNGFGCGMMLDGKLRRGANFSAGEIGYMSYGEIGYLEERLSPSYLLSHFGYNAYADDQNHDIPVNDYEKQIRVADHISKYLSHSIRSIAALLDVNHYILGGFLIDQLKEPIFRYTQERLSSFELSRIHIDYETSRHIAAKGMGAQVMDNTIRNHIQ